MATLEITVSDKASGKIKARQSFELDDDLVRLFMAEFDRMLAGLPRPVRVVKTISPGGAAIDITTWPYSPPVASPSFEDIYRRRALPPPQPGTPL